MSDNCACTSDDAYHCWSTRYGKHKFTCVQIEKDGGPCECSCHERSHEDEREDALASLGWFGDQ